MRSETKRDLPEQQPSDPDFEESSLNRCALHVLTLTPFFPFEENPVYGTYVSEPIAHFERFNLHSTVVGVSPLHHKRRHPLPGVPAEWLRYATVPGNVGLTTAGLFLFRRLLPFARRLHERNAIGVIHAHAPLPCGHAAMLLAERMNVPFVVTIHGLDVFNACFEPGTGAAERRARLSAEIYRRAASVICISKMVENILKRDLPPVPSCVIYNGTDPELFSPQDVSRDANRQGGPTILVVGNLLRGKGHETVLAAMAQVSAQFPELRGRIIGEGADRQRFSELVRSLGIAKRVLFYGRQDRKAVAEAMRDCTIFALPSRFEALGCAYLEAMASGKPVIACEGQGIGEIIKHGQNGWLIPADGVPEMADALRQLLASPALRERIGSNARRTIVGGLRLADQAHRLGNLYRSVTRS